MRVTVGVTWDHRGTTRPPGASEDRNERDGGGTVGGAGHPGDPWGFGGPVPTPRPGIVPLRPLGIGELLDGGMQTIRRHPRLVLGTAALVAVLTEALQVPVRYLLGDSLSAIGSTGGVVPPDRLGEVFGRLLGGLSTLAAVSYVVGLLGSAVLSGLLTVVVGRAVLGAPVEARDCWRAARTRVAGLIGIALITLLVELLVLAVALIPAGLVLLLGGGAVLAVVLAVLGALVGLLAIAVVAVLVALAPPAYVLEGEGVVAALRRSVTLVRARFWPVLGALALTILIVVVVAGVLSAPFSVGGQLLTLTSAGSTGGAPTLTALLIQSVGTIMALTVTAPFSAAVIGLLYVDQRMRREGFDIELQRAAASARPMTR